MLQDKENYSFNIAADVTVNAFDEGYKQGSKETAKSILNEIECFFWETAINDTKYFDLYENLYRSIKEHIKNKYDVDGVGGLNNDNP